MEAVSLKIIKIHGNYQVLKTPLILDVRYDDGEYIVSNEDLNVHSFSKNIEEAIEDIKKSIETLWIEFVDADINILTEDAIGFRSKLKEMFE